MVTIGVSSGELYCSSEVYRYNKMNSTEITVLNYTKSNLNSSGIVESYSDELNISISYPSTKIKHIPTLNEAFKKIYSIKHKFVNLRNIEYTNILFKPNIFEYIYYDCLGILFSTRWKVFTFYENYYECHVNNKPIYRMYYKDFFNQKSKKYYNQIVKRKSLRAELNYLKMPNDLRKLYLGTNIFMAMFDSNRNAYNIDFDELEYCIGIILKDIR